MSDSSVERGEPSPGRNYKLEWGVEYVFPAFGPGVWIATAAVVIAKPLLWYRYHTRPHFDELAPCANEPRRLVHCLPS